MTDEVTTGGIDDAMAERSVRRLIPMQIGSATIFVEQKGDPPSLDLGDAVFPVSLPSPQQAFERAGDFLQECVRIFDSRIGALQRKPQEVNVEFSLGFEVTGRATLIPILLSGETSTQAAIRVSATWQTDSRPG